MYEYVNVRPVLRELIKLKLRSFLFQIPAEDFPASSKPEGHGDPEAGKGTDAEHVKAIEGATVVVNGGATVVVNGGATVVVNAGVNGGASVVVNGGASFGASVGGCDGASERVEGESEALVLPGTLVVGGLPENILT